MQLHCGCVQVSEGVVGMCKYVGVQVCWYIVALCRYIGVLWHVCGCAGVLCACLLGIVGMCM